MEIEHHVDLWTQGIMAKRVSSPQQISDTLADVALDLAGVKLPVSSLTGGFLVVGETGCGKTRSIVNNVSRQFATMFTESGKATAEKRQFAVFYFGLKGQGHSEFIQSLPAARRQDVIHISNDRDCPWVVRLFERDSWASDDDLHLAVVNYIEDVAAELSGPATTGRHDPFWNRQRIRLLTELCRLEVLSPEHFQFVAEETSALTHQDALVALLARIEAFLDFIAEKSIAADQPTAKSQSSLRQDLKEQGFETSAELLRAEKIVTAYSKLPHLSSQRKARALTVFLATVLKRARQERRTAKPKTLLDAFSDTLEPSSRQRLLKLVEQFWRIPEVTRGCIEADLRGIVQSFHSGAAKSVFGGVGKREVSIEEVIDRGLIMVIDLPVADSGNASLPALIALKLAISQRLIGRYKALYKGRLVSRRGVLIVQDEAQVLMSALEAKALSVIREFGVIWLLATQSLSLVASVLGSGRDTEAFLAAARTRIFGATSDHYTAELASRLCGRSPSIKQRTACLWHPTPELEAAVSTWRRTDTPLVPAHRFFELQTGQFYVRTAGNHCVLLDLHFNLPAPRAEVLSRDRAERS